MSTFFIDRPIFAAVISIVIVLAGLVAMRSLPIAQYPEIVPPQVVVSATYPGASAQTIAETVAAPLEQQINGVEGMIYMQSTSTGSGTLNLSVYFQTGTNPDQATINVNNRVQRATALLPEEVRRQGVTVTKRSSSILQVLTMSSPDRSYDTIYISNYALVNVLDELRRTPGVGDASLFGASDYSMRIWLRPDKVARYERQLPGRHGDRLQSASNSWVEYHGRVRVLPSGQVRWKPGEPRSSDAAGPSGREPAAGARRRLHDL